MASTVFPGRIDEAGLRVRRETARVVWRRAYELAERAEHPDRLRAALELNRAACHDASTIAHAFALGRTHVREHVSDADARGGLHLLQETIRCLVSDSVANAKSTRARR
ncbi:MAG: hypothetical protein QOE35_1858 [Actinomycetota bacterium]|jgi:hypothetical protein